MLEMLSFLSVGSNDRVRWDLGFARGSHQYLHRVCKG